MGSRVAGILLGIVLLVAATGVTAGWRPEVDGETDAEWLARLDSRLAPVHGALRDTLELLGAAGTDAEVDAYIVLIQAQAIKGITVLDSMEPARACAHDYASLERTLMLMLGDSGDAWRQFRAGSAQALVEAQGLAAASIFILTDYGDRVRLSTVCEAPTPEPTAVPVPSPGPERTPTPVATPSAS